MLVILSVLTAHLPHAYAETRQRFDLAPVVPVSRQLPAVSTVPYGPVYLPVSPTPLLVATPTASVVTPAPRQVSRKPSVVLVSKNVMVVSKQESTHPTLQTEARDLVTQEFGATEWDAFNRIITQESGWDFRATEPSTQAYGLCQSLPANKMRSAGADYLTNPRTQLLWCLSYIKERYGSPAKAWRFHVAHNWF